MLVTFATRVCCVPDTYFVLSPVEPLVSLRWCLPRPEFRSGARWRRRQNSSSGSAHTRAPVRRVCGLRLSMMLQAAFLIAAGFSHTALRRPCENAAYQEPHVLTVLANVEHGECVRHRGVLATPSMRGTPPLVTPAFNLEAPNDSALDIDPAREENVSSNYVP